MSSDLIKQAKSTIMKAIIYAGISLFSVATVYGLADYYSSNKKGTIDKMYSEEKVLTPVAPEIDKTKIAEVPDKSVVETVLHENKPAAVKVKSTKKLKQSSRKINLKEFSRARIPDHIVLEDLKDEPVKKMEVKKQ